MRAWAGPVVLSWLAGCAAGDGEGAGPLVAREPEAAAVAVAAIDGGTELFTYVGKELQIADYDVDWNALQILPGKLKASVNVRQYSDILFQQRYQDDFNRATSRTQRWSGALEKDLKLAETAVAIAVGE